MTDHNARVIAGEHWLDPDRYGGNEDVPILESGIARRNVKCPGCKDGTAEWYEETIPLPFDHHFTEDREAGWSCGVCEWEQEADQDDYVRAGEFEKTLQPRIDAAWEAVIAWNPREKEKTPTVWQFFADLNMPEGDFKWDDPEAGDSHVYCCGERDCPVQWHTIAYATNIGRREGKLYIEEMDVDSDGNWDINESWEEGDDYEVFRNLMENMQRLDEYFVGWARYWLDAIITRKDPCDQATRPVPDGEWTEFCLEAVEDNIKYLTHKKEDKTCQQS